MIIVSFHSQLKIKTLIHQQKIQTSFKELDQKHNRRIGANTIYRRRENLLSSVSQKATAIQVLTDQRNHLTYNGLWNYLQCEEIFASDRPVHSAQTWNHARQVYKQIVGSDQSSIGTKEDDETISNGFQVAYEVKKVLPKGRGIFADQDIQKGQLIWSTKKTARFSDGDSFRKFTLSVERGFACDVLNVSYVQRLENGELQISTDLDDGSLCNGEDEDNDANMGCDKDAAKNYKGGCVENYFALSDIIKIGDELICAYGSFAVANGWKEFGL